MRLVCVEMRQISGLCWTMAIYGDINYVSCQDAKVAISKATLYYSILILGIVAGNFRGWFDFWR
jgi:hypothetical protein